MAVDMRNIGDVARFLRGVLPFDIMPVSLPHAHVGFGGEGGTGRVWPRLMTTIPILLSQP